MDSKSGIAQRMRLDAWLWTARVYASRTLAHAAVHGGHVRVNARPAKPAHAVGAGDVLRISGEDGVVRTLNVLGIAPRRVPARLVPGLYAETPESVALRAAAREQRRLEGTRRTTRPGPRDRRALIRLRRGS